MKLMFTSEDMDQVIVYKDGETPRVFSYPPKFDADKELVEEFGGDYEIRRATGAYARELEKDELLWERFQKGKAAYLDSLSISAITERTIDKSDMMKIKMSMFKEDIVKDCQDKKLLASLRKADDIVDVMMYYGMIRAASRSV